MSLKNDSYLKEIASNEPGTFNELFLNFKMELYDHENELRKLEAMKSTRGALKPDEKNYESLMKAKKGILEGIVEELETFYNKK